MKLIPALKGATAVFALFLLPALDAAALPLQVQRTHGGFFAFGFSDDGKMVAGGSGAVTMTTGTTVTSRGGGEALLWDAANGRMIAALGSHDATVNWVQFSHDAAILASAANDNGTVKTWDVRGRKALGAMRVPEGMLGLAPAGVRPLCALSPDGKRVAAVGATKQTLGGNEVATAATLVVWDAATGKELWKQPKSGVAALAFTADSRTLVASTHAVTWKLEGDGAVGHHSDERFVGWDADSGKERFSNPSPGFNPSQFFFASNGGSVLALSGQRSAWFDNSNGNKVRDQRLGVQRSLLHARLDPAGNRLLAIEFMGDKIHSIDLASGQPTLVLDTRGLMNRVWHPAISPDLKRLAANQNNRPVLLDL